MKIKTDAILQLGMEMMLAEIQAGRVSRIASCRVIKAISIPDWKVYANEAERILQQIEIWAKERDKDND